MAPTVLVGREPEAAAVASFLGRATRNSRVMLVEGEVGIGKTSILAAARDTARARGWRVLAANPAELEMPLEYTGIADLLEPLPVSLTDSLPAPQRRAIRVALLPEEAPEPSVDLRTIATAAVAILRRLADAQPVLLIIDDLHWLDLASARVLAFVLRRLPPASVSLLASVRTGWADGRPALATDAIPPGRLDRLTLGPLSLGAARELVTTRTPFRPGRPALLNLHQLTGGNPMFLLELAGRPGAIESIIAGRPPLLDREGEVPASVRRPPLPATAVHPDRHPQFRRPELAARVCGHPAEGHLTAPGWPHRAGRTGLAAPGWPISRHQPGGCRVCCTARFQRVPA